MSQPDFRQEKVYRRGLVLGLTIAEVMILLMFILLISLAAAVARRDSQIRALDHGGASRLMDQLREAFPNVPESEYFRELRLALDARETLEASGPAEARASMLRDAELGRRAREAARRAGAADPAAYAERRMGGRGPNEGLPFFSLSEAGGFYFDSGRATLRPEFAAALRDQIIPRLDQMIRQHDVRLVEVIGHTDEVPMSGISNLDRLLIAASTGSAEISALQSTDNAGLAMSRAVAVARILRTDVRFRDVTIVPLSGAQLIMPGDRPADGTARGDDRLRRRVEIRLRERSGQQQGATVRGGR